MLDRGVDRLPVSRPGNLALFFETVRRLIVPVLALVGLFVLAWTLRREAAVDLRFLIATFPSLEPAFTMPGWLNWGYLMLPGLFFMLNLISRRYGPSMALWSVLVSWVVLAGLVCFALLQGMIADFQHDLAPFGLAATFVGALFLGQIVSIAVFDYMRGIPWWQAPLWAALLGGLVFSIAFNARAALDWDEALGERLIVEAGIVAFWAVAQLLPTLMLRGAIRPLPGYGGA
ncbi:MAG: hypothetical protein WBN97_07140 [Parvibaculum sp.]